MKFIIHMPQDICTLENQLILVRVLVDLLNLFFELGTFLQILIKSFLIDFLEN